MTLGTNYVVQLDDVQAQRVGHIYSLVAGEEIQNGMVGIAGNLVAGEREVRNFDKPVEAQLAQQRAVLVDQSEIIPDESSRASNNLRNFSIEPGKIFRAYELHNDDLFSVSEEAVDAIDSDKGPQAGNYVVLQDGSYKLKEVKAADTENHAFVGHIEDRHTIGRPTLVGQNGVIAGGVVDFAGIRVVSNHPLIAPAQATTSTTTVNP